MTQSALVRFAFKTRLPALLPIEGAAALHVILTSFA